MKFLVVGAGGHARVVIEALKSSKCGILGCLDPKLKGKTVDGVRVLGGDEVLDEHKPGSVALAIGVGGVVSVTARRAVFERLAAAGHALPPVVAASAHRSESAVLGDGCQLLTRCVVHPGAKIGPNTVVNTCAIVEHGCLIGAHGFIGPGAVVCGEAALGDSVFVGAGALILPGVAIGDGAFIGAGAIVNKDVPAGAKTLPRRIKESV